MASMRKGSRAVEYTVLDSLLLMMWAAKVTTCPQGGMFVTEDSGMRGGDESLNWVKIERAEDCKR